MKGNSEKMYFSVERMGSVSLPSAILPSRLLTGAGVIRGSGVAATEIKEWTLVRTVIKSKKEENMAVVNNSENTHKFPFQAHVFVCSRTDPLSQGFQ
jgi:hypothetical protein